MGNFKLEDRVAVKKDTSIAVFHYSLIKEAIITNIHGNEVLIRATSSPLNDPWFTFTREKYNQRLASAWVHQYNLLPLEEKYIDPLIYI